MADHEENKGLIQRGEETPPKKTYGSITAFAISINYIIGTGVFGLPYGFYSSGLLLGIICLTVSGIFSLMCINWVLEVMARAEGVVKSRESQVPGVYSYDQPIHRITYRKFDFSTLFSIFTGWKGRAFCQVTIILFCYGVLWAYASVFSSSVSSLFFQFAFDEKCDLYHDPSSGCKLAYNICLIIYALIVVTMSCIDMAEQAIVQLMMTCYRFTAFAVMMITLIIALCFPKPDKFSETKIPMFDMAGFAAVFTSGAVALNFHSNLPDIAKPTRNKEKLTSIVSGAQIVAFGFYITLACLCSVYFESGTEPLVTLNWQEYTGREGGWGGSTDHRPWYAIVVQLFVMLFPVFDMLSVFPLVAITLGNNMLDGVPRRYKSRFGEHRVSIACRLAASIPPIIFAALLGKLDQIFTFAGLFAFFLELIFPCFLQIMSVRFCEREFGPNSWKTPYTLFFSTPAACYATLVFGAFALLFAIINFADPDITK